MNLKVLGSSSAGNCYILENEEEALIIECGVKFTEIKKALDFRLEKVAGCLITHEHKDHCKSAIEVATAGIDVYATAGTVRALGFKRHNLNEISLFEEFKSGNFKILAFDIKHDCNEPCGFLISHEETGTICFITDTYYVPYTFDSLNNIIIEANYSQKIIDDKVAAGVSRKFLRNRILQSHMSIDTCKGFLAANNLNQVNNIVLIHLSDSNSDAEFFRLEIEKQTKKQVHIAKVGLEISFNSLPF